MVRFFICIGLIAALVTLAVFGTAYVGNVTEEVAALLDGIAEGTADPVSAAEEAQSIWNSFYERNFLITDKEHAMEITVSLARISALAEENDDDLTVECITTKKLLLFFRDKQIPDFPFGV